ncbi:GntR family transcriptional regulator [Actinopolymorpha cephalotaxi]|uniref:DNA-binding GntR family transcriptional regulator n=2 Tax=Actinopolymorpha cephalotaxi TaxID=504797 RepID=A0ABX2S0A0_9ACTN|nr:GntR family transcriptional regulator [Actinopolymorpha cephalotaxi]NYH83028.1 DNA-binding GntR family transcriptional regulator [Actinopolymorpha cephalotaxi]
MAGRRRIDPPSLVQLAAQELRRMILAGELAPGERLIEERLTEELGISRPPLREAMRTLQHEGLVEITPRRGASVTRLADGDVVEILTLRSSLERLAVEMGVPVTDPTRLARCRAALAEMQRCAESADRAQLVERGYEFHRAIVGLAGHRRLEGIYDSLHQQQLWCMAMNLHTREHFYEDLGTHVARHRDLLDLIEAGDPDAVLHALAHHGERSFTHGFRQPRQDAPTAPDAREAPGTSDASDASDAVSR